MPWKSKGQRLEEEILEGFWESLELADNLPLEQKPVVALGLRMTLSIIAETSERLSHEQWSATLEQRLMEVTTQGQASQVNNDQVTAVKFSLERAYISAILIANRRRGAFEEIHPALSEWIDRTMEGRVGDRAGQAPISPSRGSSDPASQHGPLSPEPTKSPSSEVMRVAPRSGGNASSTPVESRWAKIQGDIRSIRRGIDENDVVVISAILVAAILLVLGFQPQLDSSSPGVEPVSSERIYTDSATGTRWVIQDQTVSAEELEMIERAAATIREWQSDPERHLITGDIETNGRETIELTALETGEFDFACEQPRQGCSAQLGLLNDTPFLITSITMGYRIDLEATDCSQTEISTYSVGDEAETFILPGQSFQASTTVPDVPASQSFLICVTTLDADYIRPSTEVTPALVPFMQNYWLPMGR